MSETTIADGDGWRLCRDHDGELSIMAHLTTGLVEALQDAENTRLRKLLAEVVGAGVVFRVRLQRTPSVRQRFDAALDAAKAEIAPPS